MTRLWHNVRPALRLLLRGNGSRAAAPDVSRSATLQIGQDVRRQGGRIVVGAGSHVTVGEGVYLDADIIVGEGCRVVIGARSRLRNTVLRVANGGVVEIGSQAIFDNPLPPANPIVVDDGMLILGDCVRIQAELLVRFGGRLNIGAHTGIGYGSEIRCEEQVDIGAYGLFSYEVCIYDTNTHSTDWQERRVVIDRMHGSGMGETVRPETAPVWIGDDVWLGKGATVLKGARIGHRSIIGIRTVVGGGVYPDDSVLVSPAPRVIARS